MKNKSLWLGIMAVMLCLALFPASAIAEIRDTKQVSGNEIVITYRYLATDEEPMPEETIDHDGKTFKVASVEVVTDDEHEPEIREFEYSSNKLALTADEVNNASTYFPSVHVVDEDGFFGSIPLVDTQSEIIYFKYNDQADRLYQVSGGLPNNDIETLYAMGYDAMEYEVKSEIDPGATEVKILHLAYPHLYPVSYDQFGIPTEWGADLYYRGEESWLEEDHYLVVANYRGEVESTIGGQTKKVTYVEENIAPERVIYDNEIPLSGPTLSILWGVGGVLIIALIWLLRRVRLVERQENGKEQTKLRPKTTKVNSTESRIEIPPTIKITPDTYHINAPWRYARKKGQVLVVQNSRIFYQGEWKKRMELVSSGDLIDKTLLTTLEGVEQ